MDLLAHVPLCAGVYQSNIWGHMECLGHRAWISLVLLNTPKFFPKYTYILILPQAVHQNIGDCVFAIVIMPNFKMFANPGVK